MHPILFRIPLPKTQLPALYIYLAVIALGLLYAAAQFFIWKSKSNAIGGLVVAGIGVAGKLFGFIEKIAADKDTLPDAAGLIPVGPIPIYSYGVMLGLSLVVGWYLTLTLCEKDGLPKETMANNYVVTAIAAIAGSRILYVLTNLNEFNSPIDIFALRRGGLVAYGGFLGGFLGSLFYLRRYRIPLLPWADVAVPSLASGLMITRIGCYLFGCDFGRPLCGAKNMVDCASPEAPPQWLQTLGTFPKWAPGLLHEGNGSEGAPAWSQHIKHTVDPKAFDYGLDPSATHSFPVHPTQIYESLVGMGLLALLLLSRRNQKFRGQIFLLFTFAYGICRYLLEILRDDEERGSLPFTGGKHTMIALGLAIFAAGFVVGFSKLIKNTTTQRLFQVLSFVPAVILYFAMAPGQYGTSIPYQWSTSQFVAITTGFAACAAFSVLYKGALAHPESAMRIVLPPPEGEPAAVADADADADDDDEEDEEKPAKKDAKKAGDAETSKKEGAAKPKARASAEAPAAKSEGAAKARTTGKKKPVKKAAPAKPKAEEADDDDGEKPAAESDDAAPEKKSDEAEKKAESAENKSDDAED